jgi:hypothetical protein
MSRVAGGETLADRDKTADPGQNRRPEYDASTRPGGRQMLARPKLGDRDGKQDGMLFKLYLVSLPAECLLLQAQ